MTAMTKHWTLALKHRVDKEHMTQRGLLKTMWTASFRYSRRKIKIEAYHMHHRDGWRQVVCDLCSTSSNKE